MKRPELYGKVVLLVEQESPLSADIDSWTTFWENSIRKPFKVKETRVSTDVVRNPEETT